MFDCNSIEYDGNKLVESKDIDGNVYKYDYDGNYNMTKIGYSDGTSMEIEYTAKTQFVSKITDRNKNTTAYEYGEDPKKS